MEKPKSKIKVILPILLLLVATGVAVKLLFFSHPFLYAGTIEATKVDVPARVTSVLATEPVREGDHVTQGQTLLTLSCEDYKLNDEMATLDYDRAARLYKVGSQPQETYQQMKNRKDDTALKLSWCTVTSPLTGVILNKYHEVGEMVNPGIRLFTLADLKNSLYAYIYVPQSMVAKLKLGEKLVGYLPEMNMRPFDGTIIKIGDEAEFTPKNVQTREERTRLVFGIKVAFDNPEEILKPGMTVEVKVPEM